MDKATEEFIKEVRKLCKKYNRSITPIHDYGVLVCNHGDYLSNDYFCYEFEEINSEEE